MSERSAQGQGPVPLAENIELSVIGNRTILIVLCLCSFGTLFNARSIGPILVDISSTYGITVAQAGTLGAAYSLPAVFLSLLFGPLSDRYGRRRLMLLGLLLLVLTSLGGAFSPSFPFLLVCRVLAGMGAAAVVPSTFASFGDFFPYSERGRAMSWQVAITTMAIVVGLPVGSVLAGLLSWRWMFGVLSMVFAIVGTLVLTRLPSGPPAQRHDGSALEHYRRSFVHIFRNRSALAALGASCMHGLFWQSWGTYIGAYFIKTFEISTEALAPILVLSGLGTVLTSLVSGRIADHFSKRNLAAVAMGICSVIIALLTNASGVLWVAIALNTLLAVPVGLRIVSANALLTELVPQARGTMMSMNTSMIEVGSMTGVLIGGMVIESTGGYAALGSVFGAAALVGALLLYFLVTDIVGEVQPATA